MRAMRVRASIAVAISVALVVADTAPLIAVEYATEALFADSTYVSGAILVEKETLDFLLVRYRPDRWPPQWLNDIYPRRRLRYLVYGDFAVPYSNGEARPRIGLTRNRRFPRSGLLVFSLAGVAMGAWFHARAGDADDEYQQMKDLGLLRSTNRYRNRREDYQYGAWISFGVAIVLGIVGLRSRMVWDLADGTVILPFHDGRYETSGP